MIKKVTVAAVALGLSGCAALNPRTPEFGVGPGKVYHSSRSYLAQLSSERATLINAKACCASFSALPYEELPKIPGSLRLQFDRNTAVFNFATGKSYVRGVKLPEIERSYSLRFISNHQTTNMSVTSGGFFCPSILILDSSFRPIGGLDCDSFKYYSDESVGFQTDSGLRAEIAITGGLSKKARYLVIHTTVQAMAKKTQYMFTGSRVYAAPSTEDEIRRQLSATNRWLVIAPNVPVGAVQVEAITK